MAKRSTSKKQGGPPTESPYISPNELADRWRCTRSSVDRIARRNGLKRLCPGEGRNGIVRYEQEEVEAYEASRRISTVA